MRNDQKEIKSRNEKRKKENDEILEKIMKSESKEHERDKYSIF